MSGHHPCSHRVCESPLGGCFCICLANLGMVGKTEVVVKAPVEHLLAVEHHMRAEFSLETGIHIVSECLVEILSYRTA